MPRALSGTTALHYELVGDPRAPALVLIRGLARSIGYWLDFRDRVARRFRLVLLDNRGVGRSDRPRPPYRTTQMADDVAAVLDHAGIDRAHVFGVSLGGMIAQWVALRHPARVDRLALGCTTAGGSLGRRVPVDAAASLLRGAFMPFEGAMRHTAPFVISASTLSSRPDVLERWMALAREQPVPLPALLGQLLAGMRHDASGHLDRIEAPTLVLTGDADRLIPAANSYLLAERIPGARLCVLPGAGHDFPTDQPDATARVLESFLLGS